MSLPTTWCICLLCEHEVAAAAQGDLNIPLLTGEQCGSTKHQKHTWASEGIVKTSDSYTKWSYVAWGPTYKVLYAAVTVEWVALWHPLLTVLLVGVTILDSVGLYC